MRRGGLRLFEIGDPRSEGGDAIFGMPDSDVAVMAEDCHAPSRFRGSGQCSNPLRLFGEGDPQAPQDRPCAANSASCSSTVIPYLLPRSFFRLW